MNLFRFFHVSFGLVIIVAIAVCKSTFLVCLIFFGSLLSTFFNFLALYLFEEVMQLCSNIAAPGEAFSTLWYV